ncbi:cysteine hydrolase [Ideonella sp. DXS29W]|uniref:Cysteine hydrolase n=1 Tax=Ideonella lacteola TaxID=2984193 RepID=A0ABU9BHX5_9BURK
MSRRTQLLIIDPQNDFCDLPDSHRPIDPLTQARMAPALPVVGAHADMLRLAHFVNAARDALDAISITLDSHHRIDIAHPGFWCQADGTTVSPFTTITAAQVRAGAYRPRDATALPRAMAYLDELDRLGRYTLMVWPVHCEIGTWGHNVHADLKAALASWEEQRLAVVQTVTKGENPWTEHYSAMQAEVPDADDPHTQLNQALIDQLDQADLLLIGGEASSHCVKATTEHIVTHLRSGRMDKVVLLTDAMSPVGGFEAQHEAFFADMRARGVRLARCDEALQWLRTPVAA